MLKHGISERDCSLSSVRVCTVLETFLAFYYIF